MSLTQQSFEARIAAELPPAEFAASGEAAAASFMTGRFLDIVVSVARTTINIATDLPGRLDDATFAMLVSAAKVVLTSTLTAMGFPPALVTAAATLLVMLIEQYHTGS